MKVTLFNNTDDRPVLIDPDYRGITVSDCPAFPGVVSASTGDLPVDIENLIRSAYHNGLLDGVRRLSEDSQNGQTKNK